MYRLGYHLLRRLRGRQKYPSSVQMNSTRLISLYYEERLRSNIRSSLAKYDDRNNVNAQGHNMFGDFNNLCVQLSLSAKKDYPAKDFVFVPLKQKPAKIHKRYLYWLIGSVPTNYSRYTGVWTNRYNLNLLLRCHSHHSKYRIGYIVRIKSLKAGVTSKEYTTNGNDLQRPLGAHVKAPEG